MSAEEPARERPTLHCLGGRPVPPGVLADLAKLRSLSPAARSELWEVLDPTLPDPIPATAGAAIDGFARKHGIEGTDLAVGLKACRFLLREASRLDLSAPKLAEDLAALDDGSGELGRLLLGSYEVAKATIREGLVSRALLRHGKVLLGVEWRLDAIAASDEVRGVRVPVAMLTLRYVEQGQPRSVTLQAPAATLRKLQAVCAALLAERPA